MTIDPDFLRFALICKLERLEYCEESEKARLLVEIAAIEGMLEENK